MDGRDPRSAYMQPAGLQHPSGFVTSAPASSPPTTSVTPATSMSPQANPTSAPPAAQPASAGKKKSRRNVDPSTQKRRCVSTACVACRKRKSKCDGALPSCAACASVYCTECVYDPNSDHRRKGVYREKVDSMKAQNSTLQILIEAILNADEEDVPAIVKRIRTCDSLDSVAESIVKNGLNYKDNGDSDGGFTDDGELAPEPPAEGEIELARKMGELRLENGSVRFIGGTSHLIYFGDSLDDDAENAGHMTGAELSAALVDQAKSPFEAPYTTTEEAINSWTNVTTDTPLIIHLMNMYFNWHYTYFTTLSKTLFYRDYLRGRPQVPPKRTVYCTSLLVNAMLSLGCHFTGIRGAFAVPGDSRTKGDHFFAEAKRLIVDNDEYAKPRLATVQALALMSVREAGCARESKGWVYSGMSFRMAQDIGLNYEAGSGSRPSGGFADGDTRHHQLSDAEIDARRITFWGCFLFDKAWSNYLGRLPQLPKNSYSVPKYDVFPDEDAELWSPFTDSGFDVSLRQPSRTRAIGLQLSELCEISSDLLLFFYHPNHIGRSNSKALELKKLSELHRRLEDWRRDLPVEFEPKEGQLPNVILTHMFFHLQYIHLFRPFLIYSPKASPLPSHVSPRRICTANAGAISKLMRLYKKTYNLRQICNIAVYMVHSACTVHLLNLPEKTAKRNVIHGVKELEEIAEDWLCARRSLSIISVLVRKWGVELPDEAAQVLARSDDKYGMYSTSDVPSPHQPPNSTFAGASSQPSSPHGGGQDMPSERRGMEHSASPSMLPGIVKSEPFGAGDLSSATVPGLYDAFAQQSQSLQGYSTSNLTPEYLGDLRNVTPPVGSLDVPAQNQGLSPQGAGGSATHGAPGVGMGGPMGNMSHGWPMQPAVTQPMQGFQHLGFAPPTAQHETLAHMYGMDGQDWFLKDGATWQQNFEGWGYAPQQPSSSPAPAGHTQKRQQQSMSGANEGLGVGGNDDGGVSDSNLFMFHGVRNSDLEVSFHDLGDTAGGLDGLGSGIN